MPHNDLLRVGRRALLQNGTLLLAAASWQSLFQSSQVRAQERPSALRVGLMTDLHYADKRPAGSRYYRETPDKLAEAAEQLSREKLAFVAELGDFIDAADSVKTELDYLERINRDFSAICPDRHYVLGNHCVHTLTKEEFLGGVEQRNSYYSFDSGGFHFVILDACFRSDGAAYGRKNFEWTDPNVPAAELEWLRADLEQTNRKTLVFTHQRLDVGNHYAVKNAPQVRKVLERSGNVLAVFQGHSHQNDYREIGGIHYCTLVAMVEGTGPQKNGYAIMSVASDGGIRVEGFRRQADYEWSA